MCRLLAVRGAAPAAWDYYMLRAPTPFRTFGDRRNPDGWGLAWYEDGVPVLFKEPRAAPASRILPPLAAGAVSTTTVAHLRKASQGSLRRANCHPFTYDGWVFAHNGTIREAARLKQALRPRHRRALTSETDSEIYFHALLQSIEDRHGDVVAGLRDITSRLTDFTAANFILTDGKWLHAYRNALERPGYFSLFYRRALRPAAGRPAIPHVVVASNRLTSEPWRPIPRRHLLTVAPDLSVSLIKLH